MEINRNLASLVHGLGPFNQDLTADFDSWETNVGRCVAAQWSVQRTVTFPEELRLAIGLYQHLFEEKLSACGLSKVEGNGNDADIFRFGSEFSESGMNDHTGSRI